jgi:pyruvate dehydrogenase E2 component (dihydrolipoamide acetyltransferase)
METGKLTAWMKFPGDQLSPGDVIAEVETDKAVVSFECQDDGYMAAHLLPEGSEDVPVGAIIALMVDEESEVAAIRDKAWPSPLDAVAPPAAPASSVAPAPPKQHKVDSASTSTVNDPTHVMPAARRLLLQHGVDAAALTGTGRKGRITKGDVLVHLGLAPSAALPSASNQKTRAAPAGTAQASTTPAASGGDSGYVAYGVSVQRGSLRMPPQPKPELPIPAQRPAGIQAGSFSDTKASGMRRTISSRLTESKSTVPHMYVQADCVIDALMAQRAALKAAGIKVSLNDMVIKAVAKALRDVPEANGYFDTDTGVVKQNTSVDISIAVATEGGLITPIVTNADQRGLLDINLAVKDLAGRARSGKLAGHEYQGGTFTVSNLGMFGISDFTAVINPPQACILAVGSGRAEVLLAQDAEAAGGIAMGDDGQPTQVGDAEGLVSEDECVVVTKMSVQLSGDRRVVDEAIAGQFLAALQAYLNNPVLLMT